MKLIINRLSLLITLTIFNTITHSIDELKKNELFAQGLGAFIGYKLLFPSYTYEIIQKFNKAAFICWMEESKNIHILDYAQALNARLELNNLKIKLLCLKSAKFCGGALAGIYLTQNILAEHRKIYLYNKQTSSYTDDKS